MTKKLKDISYDDFRDDIIKSTNYDELKKKYNIKTRSELESCIYRLSQIDKKFYAYEIPAITRGCDYFRETKVGLMTSKKHTDEIKSKLGLQRLEEEAWDVDGNKLIITFKTA